ncbi:MAG: ABC transporter ATP-binding protein [Bacteroidetes bacterium]|nr:ABC transporter ATP-binding protein [Bacteroidota bacterium]
MNILLENTGKEYDGRWIFNKLSFEFKPGNSYAVTGANGSGKSTLLKIISGYTPPSFGKISHNLDGKIIQPDFLYRYLSLSSPHMELPGEMTLEEMIVFHDRLKPFRNDYSPATIIDALGMEERKSQQIKNFSSGMKQRLQLALAILSDTRLLLLDEPLTNLDTHSVQWYLNLVMNHSKNRVVIVASNKAGEEYSFCREVIKMENYRNL